MDSWAWANEEEPPFSGLPPLPKVFREPSSSPSSLPEKGGQDAIKPLEESRSSPRDRLTWLRSEMLKLRLVDVALFNQLYTLALEIQDLKELQQETESFFKEELLTDETSQARGLHLAMRTRPAAPFELSI